MYCITYMKRRCKTGITVFVLCMEDNVDDTAKITKIMSGSVLRPKTKNEGDDELFPTVFRADDGAACKKR